VKEEINPPVDTPVLAAGLSLADTRHESSRVEEHRYVGLIVAELVYALKFATELVHLIGTIGTGSSPKSA
jgi:hypothetical protein